MVTDSSGSSSWPNVHMSELLSLAKGLHGWIAAGPTNTLSAQQRSVNTTTLMMILPSLEDLPPEILRRVCEYALPQGLKFSFQQRDPDEDSDPSWSLYVEGRHQRRDICKDCGSWQPCKHDSIVDEVHTSLLYINKCIAAEARGMYLQRPDPTWQIQLSDATQLSSSAAIYSPSRSAQRLTSQYRSSPRLSSVRWVCRTACICFAISGTSSWTL